MHSFKINDLVIARAYSGTYIGVVCNIKEGLGGHNRQLLEIAPFGDNGTSTKTVAGGLCELATLEKVNELEKRAREQFDVMWKSIKSQIK